jgi:hypothetical protein
VANYSTLTGLKTVAGSIQNWVNRSDIPAAEILTEAQALIYERLRVREMQARGELSFATSAQTASLPTGFLDPVSFRPYEWASPLPFVHEDALDEYRDADGVLSSGTPSRWAIIGEAAYVDLLPSTTFAGLMLYYKTPTALSGSNETNFITDRYPSLLRYACLAKAYEHMKDQKAAEYLQFAMSTIQDINASNEMWRRNQHVPS